MDVERALLGGLQHLALLTASKHQEATNTLLKNTKDALLKMDRRQENSIKGSTWESIWDNPNVRYKGKTINFRVWRDKGISCPHQLAVGNTSHTFETLKREYKLEELEFYNFLKIKAAITRAALTPRTPVIVNYFESLNKLGRHTSHIYKLLVPTDSRLNEKTIKYWEMHSSAPFSDLDLKVFWEAVHKNKHSPVVMQTKYWLIHRCFWTPARLAATGAVEDSCWNCGAPRGDLEHLITTCPKVQGFWGKVRKFVEECTGVTLKDGLHSLVVGHMKHPIKAAQLSDLLLTIGVKCILTNWKNTKKATFRGWLNWITFLRGAVNVGRQLNNHQIEDKEWWGPLDNYLRSYKPP